jgi:hypothetical protein
METKHKPTDTFSDGFLKLAISYAEGYAHKPALTENLFASTNSIPAVMVSAYNILVTRGEVERIEDLDEEIKVKLWEQSKLWLENAGVPVTRTKREQLCKCIWLLNKITEQIL